MKKVWVSGHSRTGLWLLPPIPWPLWCLTWAPRLATFRWCLCMIGSDLCAFAQTLLTLLKTHTTSGVSLLLYLVQCMATGSTFKCPSSGISVRSEDTTWYMRVCAQCLPAGEKKKKPYSHMSITMKFYELTELSQIHHPWALPAKAYEKLNMRMESSQSRDDVLKGPLILRIWSNGWGRAMKPLK